MDAADYLRKFLEDRNMAQRELGEALGVTQATVADWLTRRRKIPLKHALRLHELHPEVDVWALVPQLGALRSIEQGHAPAGADTGPADQ